MEHKCVMDLEQVKQLVELRCDYCNRLLAKEQITEDIVIELKCHKCGKISRFVLYKIG